MLLLQFNLMMSAIKTISNLDVRLAKANELVEECRGQIKSGVDKEFLDAASMEQKLIIVADDVNVDSLGDGFVSYMNLTYFEDIFETPDDFYYVYMHAAWHRRCDQLWQKTIIKRDAFPDMVRELMEDMWIQHIFHRQISEQATDRMHGIITKYDVYRGFKYQQQRDLLHTLLLRHCSWFLPERLRYIHSYIYESRAELAKTFDVFAHNWNAAISDPDCAEILEFYQKMKD